MGFAELEALKTQLSKSCHSQANELLQDTSKFLGYLIVVNTRKLLTFNSLRIKPALKLPELTTVTARVPNINCSLSTRRKSIFNRQKFIFSRSHIFCPDYRRIGSYMLLD